MTVPDQPELVHIRNGGTSLVVDLGGQRLPRILHWGPDLGSLDDHQLEALKLGTRAYIGNSTITSPQPIPILPQLAEGWLGRPGISGSRQRRGFAPLMAITTHSLESDAGTERLVVNASDQTFSLDLALEIELLASGLLRIRARLTNAGTDEYRVDNLEFALPVPDMATELLDLTGRWSHERFPQRQQFSVGQWIRESRGGKPGFDSPTVLLAGVSGFGFRSGRVWGIHLGWSGNQVLGAERTPTGPRSFRGGELYLPDEVVLGTAESMTTPWLYGSWGDGIDELSSRFHQLVRSWPAHREAKRPVSLNTWEAMYFDMNSTRLIELAEAGAALGVERFVVDDGWFLGRRSARSSLGDWVVDPTVFPNGLEPVARRVHDLGMEFGLWFEPEMVSADSELARAHPDWLFDGGHGPGPASRYQYVLDLSHEGAYRLVFGRISGLVSELGIDYIKWDHNRFLTDAGHSDTGRPGVREQTLRLYRLLDELLEAHPGLAIESCASGGGRIDLGIMERTARAWPSDCIDPHERLDIQRWTGILLPPESQGTHIGGQLAHTTGRVSTLDFRAAVAWWGHLGIEMDLTHLADAESATVRRWIELHKTHRALLHHGTVVHGDVDAEFRLDGVVAEDRSAAFFHFAVVNRPMTWPPQRLRLPGLDPARDYDVRVLDGSAPVPSGQAPPWISGGLTWTGKLLAEVGLEAPSLNPDHSVVLRVTARVD